MESFYNLSRVAGKLISLHISRYNEIYVYRFESLYMYLQASPHEQDVTQGQFSMRVLTGLNSDFSFKTDCYTKPKDPKLPNYFTHSWMENRMIHASLRPVSSRSVYDARLFQVALYVFELCNIRLGIFMSV